MKPFPLTLGVALSVLFVLLAPMPPRQALRLAAALGLLVLCAAAVVVRIMRRRLGDGSHSLDVSADSSDDLKTKGLDVRRLQLAEAALGVAFGFVMTSVGLAVGTG